LARWADIINQEPGFATKVQALFDAHRHKILATVRQDGSPRISGIEASFADGEVWIGSLPDSRKSIDLARDPRLALHAMSDDPPEDPTTWLGDAKLSGNAVEVHDPERLKSMGGEEASSAILYSIEISEVVLTSVGDPPDHLDIDLWREGKGVARLRAQ
jgi:hypothetical protein